MKSIKYVYANKDTYKVISKDAEDCPVKNDATTILELSCTKGKCKKATFTKG